MIFTVLYEWYNREIKYYVEKSINIWLFDGEPLAIYTINNSVFCARYLCTDYSIG